jgi:capsid protein
MNQKLWNWRIAMAIRDGVLPPAPVSQVRGFMVSEWNRVEWQGNEEAWTDRQEANQADMMEWQLGIGPLSNAAKRRGSNLRELLTQKARDLKMAREIEAKYELEPDTLIKAQIPGQTETPTKASTPVVDDAPKQNGGAE